MRSGGRVRRWWVGKCGLVDMCCGRSCARVRECAKKMGVVWGGAVWVGRGRYYGLGAAAVVCGFADGCRFNASVARVWWREVMAERVGMWVGARNTRSLVREVRFGWNEKDS